jgi:hypothetical protein
MFSFAFRAIGQWPSLAWLAICREADPTIEVLHGAGVEVTADWFCEAVWAGAFADGNFDEMDLVFGSGGRMRPGSVTFVTSGTTVDRLHSLELRECTLVSNSLVCLLWFCSGQVDLEYTTHIVDLDSILHGIEGYKSTLATSAGSVRLTYFDNLAWDGSRLSVTKKRIPRRDFSDFAKYRQFVDESLRLITENMAATRRRRQFSLISSMSSGYDSATTSALALPHGLKDVFSFTTARGGDSDSGIRVAEALGINLRLIDRDAWRAHRLPEIPFIATQASGGDVFFRGVDEYLSNRVLLTGFHGDKVWGTKEWKGANVLARGDCSGSGLSEYRLSKGFFHVPLPFFAATQSTDIVKVSQLPEMDPWRLSNDYDRPICRRILEEAGVPRDAFGMSKKAVSVIFWQRGDFLTYESRQSCRRFLRSRGVRIRTLTSSVADVLAFAFLTAGKWAGAFYERFLRRVLRGRLSIIPRNASRLTTLGLGSDPFARSNWMPLTTNDRMFQHVFPWAIDMELQSYAGTPKLSDSKSTTTSGTSRR